MREPLDIKTALCSGSSTSPPPADLASSGGMHFHANMTITGTDADVQSITFANGLTFTAVTSGDDSPITHDASGFHFTRGKCFEMVPPTVVEYAAMGVFARFSTTVASTDYFTQYPIRMQGSGEEFINTNRKSKYISSDLGAAVASAKSLIDYASNVEMVMGLYFDTDDTQREDCGTHSIWFNGRVVGGSELSKVETLKPTVWRIGEAVQGSIHEAILFPKSKFNPDASLNTDPLYPPGVNSRWLCNQLAGV
jgi:hypothetical protein